MSPLVRRYGIDVLLACIGVQVAIGAVVLLVDGVELASMLGAGVEAFAEQVLARLPGHVHTLLPVTVGVAAVVVASWWERTGRYVVVESTGRPASALGRVGAVVAVLFVLGVGSIVETARTAATPVAAAQDGWTRVDGAWLRADRLTSGGAEGVVRVRRVGDDVVVDDGRNELPDPARWRAASLRVEADAPLGTLLAATPSAPRTAWLGDRLVTVVGCGALGLLAVPAARRRRGLVLVGIAAAWRVGQTGICAAEARGTWPALTGVWLPLLALGAVYFAMRWKPVTTASATSAPPSMLS